MQADHPPTYWPDINDHQLSRSPQDQHDPFNHSCIHLQVVHVDIYKIFLEGHCLLSGAQNLLCILIARADPHALHDLQPQYVQNLRVIGINTRLHQCRSRPQVKEHLSRPVQKCRRLCAQDKGIPTTVHAGQSGAAPARLRSDCSSALGGDTYYHEILSPAHAQAPALLLRPVAYAPRPCSPGIELCAQRNSC